MELVTTGSRRKLLSCAIALLRRAGVWAGNIPLCGVDFLICDAASGAASSERLQGD